MKKKQTVSRLGSEAMSGRFGKPLYIKGTEVCCTEPSLSLSSVYDSFWYFRQTLGHITHKMIRSLGVLEV